MYHIYRYSTVLYHTSITVRKVSNEYHPSDTPQRNQQISLRNLIANVLDQEADQTGKEADQ